MNTQLLRKLADDYAAGMARFTNQPWLKRQWELLKQTEGENLEEVLHALCTLGWRYLGEVEPENAMKALREALAGYRTLPANQAQVRDQMLRVRKELARALSRCGQRQDAAALMAWYLLELHRRLGDLLTARSDFASALAEYETAAHGWFDKPSSGRPPEKERLIFVSFISFWKLAAEANSPLADEHKLAEWERRLEE